MTDSEHLGLFERLFERPPLTSARATLILLLSTYLLLCIIAIQQNEFERFLVDFPAHSLILGGFFLIYAETRQGKELRYSVDLLCKEFAVDDNAKDGYLNAIFNTKHRVATGLVGSVFVMLVFESFGFWYQSAFILNLGRIFAGFIGFIVGELAMAAIYLITKTKSLVDGIANQVDVLNFRQLKALRQLSSVCLHNAVLGCIAGFLAMLGLLAAPWQTGYAATELSLGIVVGLILLVIVTFIVPVESIHEAMEDAKERMELRISEMLIDARQKSASRLSMLFNEIAILDSRVQAYPEWPFNFRQIIGVFGSLGMVVLESIIVVLLSAGLT